MKISKKILAMSLAACMTVPFLAGCGSTSTGDSTSDAAGADNSASAEGVFKIGGIGPITGGAAVYVLLLRTLLKWLLKR